MISPSYFRTASKAAWYSAALTLPFLLAIIELRLWQEQGGDIAQVLVLFIQVIDLALFLYVFSALKPLLELRFGFTTGLRPIDTLMGVYAATLVLNVIPLVLPDMQQVVDRVDIVALVAVGICFTRLGFVLRPLGDEPYGRGRHLSMGLIIMGLCMLSLVLAIFGVLVNIGVMFVLGHIFRSAADELEDEMSRKRQDGSRNL